MVGVWWFSVGAVERGVCGIHSAVLRAISHASNIVLPSRSGHADSGDRPILPALHRGQLPCGLPASTAAGAGARRSGRTRDPTAPSPLVPHHGNTSASSPPNVSLLDST